MFGSLFGKKRGAKAADKRVEGMKCRKISYVDIDLDELKNGMAASAEYILKLTPVNYYAVKNEYVLALIYSDEGLERNYVQFRRISFEKQTGATELFPIDGAVVSKALAKVGVIVKYDPERKDR